MKAVPGAIKTFKASISEICSCFGLTRDAYYKFFKRRKKREAVAKKVVELVKEERKDQPRVGGKKLYEALHTLFILEGLKVGRDKLFDILREHEMLIRRKRASCKTTDSYHRFHKYNNLVKDMEVTRPNQVWVSDITYIRTIKGFCYLALITDMYSRKIVGYDISDSLELAGCLRALKKALKAARPATQKCRLMYKNDQVIRRYSEGFKLKILAELSTGKYSKKQLGSIYGIDRSTINEWIKKYDRKDLMNTRIMIENEDDISRIKALQKEIEQLKKVIVKKDLEMLVNDSYLEVLAEKYGFKNVAELKKNLNIKPL